MPTLVNIRGLERSGASSGGGLSSGARGFRVPATSRATLTTALAGANNDITYVAKTGGTAGNSIRVTYVVSGGTVARSITVAGNDITVNLATTTGAVNATETATNIAAAVNANGSASALVFAEVAAGNDGTGVLSAMAFTNLAGGAALAERSVGGNQTVQVDLDNAEVRRRLRRNRGRFIEVLNSERLTTIRGLDMSQAGAGPSQSRGFRIKNSAGSLVTVTSSTAVTVDTSDSTVRKDLAKYFDRWVVSASGSTLVTIRGLDTSTAASTTISGGTGATASRGFSIKNKTGTVQSVRPTSNVQLNLNDSYNRRLLRRNADKFVVVSAP